MPCHHLILPLLVCAAQATAVERSFNYAEAMQKCLYFYEAQQSGRLSPNNRVAWRGDACLEDGKDVGRDLSGGWFDAGDHWTANLTMAFAGQVLAWSAVDHPQGWLAQRQMDELLENLLHVTGCFRRCILNPEAADPARDLKVCIGVGGREGVDSPNVHAMWAPAEVAHLMTNRPSFVVDRDTPGADIPAAMAACMTATALALHQHGAALTGRTGFAGFDAKAHAALLVADAAKLLAFAEANLGPVLGKDVPEAERKAVQGRRNQARRGDGTVVAIGYRANPVDQVFTALTWMARWHQAIGSSQAASWYERADRFHDGPFAAEDLGTWWRDFGAGSTGKLAALNLLALKPDLEKYHHWLQVSCSAFLDYRTTPGGLGLREWEAHQWGSLRHANNAAMIALAYSRLVVKSPPLKGNIWWKKGRTEAQYAGLFLTRAKSQVDYALGRNPYGRSYLVGFGEKPLNHPHHRGAYGAWAGFHHLIPAKPEYRPDRSRHILYGALVGGPDHNDVFVCEGARSAKREVGSDGKERWVTYYRLPGRPQPVSEMDYRPGPGEEPVQLVGDARLNEVALDYNAGFTANCAMLTAWGHSVGDALPDDRFPPRDVRNENDDLLTTDREFFAAARDRGDGCWEVQVFNRSRWPARVVRDLSFRWQVVLAAGAKPTDVRIALDKGSDAAARLGTVETAGSLATVIVSFPGAAFFPGDRDRNHDRRTVVLRVTGPVAAGGSTTGLDREWRLAKQVPMFIEGKPVGGTASR